MDRKFYKKDKNTISKSMGENNKSGNSLTFAPPPFQLQVDPTKERDRYDRIERERPERGRPEREEKGPSGSYGTPYGSWGEAFAAETFLKTTLIPAETALFGATVAGLYLSYLNRERGDDLTHQYFGEGSALSSPFTDCEVMDWETDNMMRSFIPYLGNYNLPANEWASISLQSAFGVDKMKRRINYSNPFDIPGHIAGGDGTASSDAGDDVRFAKGSVHVNRITDPEGNTTKFLMRNRLHYECFDCVDFIPGNPGTGMEQTFTIPLSRLEATNWAYDKPFQVDYPAPSKTIDISPSEIGKDYPKNEDDENRRIEPRKEKERRDNLRR